MIVVVGEVLIDVFENYQRIGGAPFNFAFHLKRLGWPVRFLTRIGDDPQGRDIQRRLASQGFEGEDIQVDRDHATGTVQVALDAAGVPRFDIRSDVAYDYIDPEGVGAIHWPSVQMIYFGSLSQRTAGAFRRIQRFIAQRSPRTRVFCDINLRPPHINAEAVLASLTQADIVKLNTEELDKIQELAGRPSQDEDGVAWMMRRFSVETAILTLGEEGSMILTANQTAAAAPTAGGRVVDTVGAGDAYAAIAAAGLLKGLPLETVAAAASGFAARICSLPGAVPEDDEVYKKLLKEIKGP